MWELGNAHRSHHRRRVLRSHVRGGGNDLGLYFRHHYCFDSFRYLDGLS